MNYPQRPDIPHWAIDTMFSLSPKRCSTLIRAMYTPNYVTDFYGYSTRPCLSKPDFRPYTGVDQLDPYTLDGYIDFDCLRGIPDYGIHVDIPATVYTLHRRDLKSYIDEDLHKEIMRFLSDMHTILVSYQPYSDPLWANDDGYEHYSLALEAVSAYLSVYINYRVASADIPELIRTIMTTFNRQLEKRNLLLNHEYHTRKLSITEGMSTIATAFGAQ